jgi:hypothetical protein
MVNDHATNIVICEAVYTKSNGAVDLARANAAATTEVAGLVSDTAIANGTPGLIMLDGIMDGTVSQWDAVLGQTGGVGLVAGTIYYLDPATAGRLTAVAPTTVGQFVVRVGRALSTTKMDLMIEPPIKT